MQCPFSVLFQIPSSYHGTQGGVTEFQQNTTGVADESVNVKGIIKPYLVEVVTDTLQWSETWGQCWSAEQQQNNMFDKYLLQFITKKTQTLPTPHKLRLLFIWNVPNKIGKGLRLKTYIFGQN